MKMSKMRLATMGATVSTAFIGVQAWAIDTVAVGTAIDAAEADALTTGEMVIGVVAGLVVIGLIIAIVKKI